MPQRPLEQLTLREMVIDAERLSHELIEHLDQGFLPKARELERLVRMEGGLPREDVEDLTVRNQASQLMESERFTDELYQKVHRYYTAIGAAAAGIVNEG